MAGAGSAGGGVWSSAGAGVGASAAGEVGVSGAAVLGAFWGLGCVGVGAGAGTKASVRTHAKGVGRHWLKHKASRVAVATMARVQSAVREEDRIRAPQWGLWV